MCYPTIRNGGASIWWLQQIKVVSHGCWMTHDARVHSKAILVTWPGQLREKEKKYISIKCFPVVHRNQAGELLLFLILSL